MNDCKFTIYNEQYVSLKGTIGDGRLELTSHVYGDEIYPDSEEHYAFSQEQTEKLFSLISLEDFIDSCRSGHLLWLSQFLEEHEITPKVWVF